MTPETKAISGDVYFTQQQLQYLESMFPHVVMPPSTTEAQMRYYFGQQAVVQAVRDRSQSFRLKEARSNRGTTADDIPTPGR